MCTPFPLINTVKAQRQQGIELALDTGSKLTLHKAGFAYYEGKENTDFSNLLDQFDQNTDLPVYFHIYSPPQMLKEYLEQDQRFNIRWRERIQLKYVRKIAPSFERPSHDISIQAISREHFDRLSEFNLDFPGQFWTSEHDFIENGIGFVAWEARKEKVVSICYSACIDQYGTVEIDVATLANYEGKGLGKLVSSHFIAHCIEQNLVPNWDCFVSNTPSLRLAEKLGFEKQSQYMFLSIYCKNRA